MELLEASNLRHVLNKLKPDEIYNLAAQSFVGLSFEQPLYTSDIDAGNSQHRALGVLRLLEAMRRRSCCPSGARLLSGSVDLRDVRQRCRSTAATGRTRRRLLLRLQHRVDRAWIKPRGPRLCIQCTIGNRASGSADRAGQWADVASSSVDSGRRRTEPPTHVLQCDRCGPDTGPLSFDFGGEQQTLCAWSVFEYDGVAGIAQIKTASGGAPTPTVTLDPLADANKSVVVGGVIANSLFGTPAQVQPGQGLAEIHEQDVAEPGTGGSLQTEDRAGSPAWRSGRRRRRMSATSRPSAIGLRRRIRRRHVDDAAARGARRLRARHRAQQLGARFHRRRRHRRRFRHRMDRQRIDARVDRRTADIWYHVELVRQCTAAGGCCRPCERQTSSRCSTTPS